MMTLPDDNSGCRSLRRLLTGLAFVSLLAGSGIATAQPGPAGGGDRPGVRESSNNPLQGAPAEVMPGAGRSGQTETKTPTDPDNPISVRVEVQHGVENAAIDSTDVTLRASRPKGPFERQEPKPEYEWTASTNDNGSVTFENVPKSLTETGLELHAAADYGGITYRSRRVPAAPDTNLTVEVFETTDSLENLSFARFRTVVKPWEGYLVFTQFYTLKQSGDRALNGNQPLGGRDQPGIPIELPLEAEGIQVQTGASNKTVNSTVFWQGTLRPGQSVPLRVRFSISASKPTFEFKQKLDYPASNVEVVAPIDVRYEKVSRLDDLRLSAPGFDTVETTDQVRNLRRNTDYIRAHGASLQAGETLRFKLYGLPFKEPLAPWIIFGLGLLGAVTIIGFAFREKRLMESDETTEQAISLLEEEREQLLDELASLEREWEAGQIDEVDYETERLRLQERLALLTQKLNELREE